MCPAQVHIWYIGQMLKNTKLNRRDFAAITGLGLSGSALGSPQSVGALYDNADAIDLQALVSRGVVSAEALLEEAISRIERLNPDLNCVSQKDYEQAREQLGHVDNSGAFAGVPFLLKDLGVQLKGTVTSGGSASLANRKAARNSTLVNRYLKAGLIVAGKTNTPEFGMAFTTESTHLGACKNPWSLEHTPAGSSGGSAAAVAAGIVPVAHASDGGGSIRVPAAACGLFGLKPSRLLTPRGPSAFMSPSAMSVNHVVSRSVRDSALMLDISKGYESGAPFGSPGNAGASSFLQACLRKPQRLRIALSTGRTGVTVDPEIKQRTLDIALQLQDLGHHVEEAAPDTDFEVVNRGQNDLVLAEFSKGMLDLAAFFQKDVAKIGLEPLTLELVYAGAKFSAADYLSNLHGIYAESLKIAEFQKSYDILLEPTTASLPPKLGVLNYQADDTPDSFVERFRKYAAFTYLYNLTGQPSASVPAGLSASGLPIGVLLSARHGEDATLLSLCAELERRQPWFNVRPKIARRPV